MHEATARDRVAHALARALLELGVTTLLVSDHGLVVLVPIGDPDGPPWPIWVTDHHTRWRYGPDADDLETHPHDGAVAAVADRIAVTARGAGEGVS